MKDEILPKRAGTKKQGSQPTKKNTAKMEGSSEARSKKGRGGGRTKSEGKRPASKSNVGKQQ